MPKYESVAAFTRRDIQEIKRIIECFSACVELARIVSAFLVFAIRPVRLIELCKAAPKPFRDI